jgi:5-formyltetrahydrofolate cyclo-ligase
MTIGPEAAAGTSVVRERHLARPRDAVLLALVFDDELVDELPVEPHDRWVTAVVAPPGGWQAVPVGH